jgi:molybdopterin-guanine dinucleotide biosynthesis protein MobB
VCYIKHAHEAPDLDGRDTDTARLRGAGAATAVLAGDSSTIVFREAGGEPLERIALLESSPGDVVLAEGFKETPGPKIAIAGGDVDVTALEGVVAIVGEAQASFAGRSVSPDDVGGLCDLIEEIAAGHGEGWTASLEIDGRAIPLNPFVQSILASGLLGMSRALEGVEEGDALVLRCRRSRAVR